jgi:very-short-patch-repair endonuclease
MAAVLACGHYPGMPDNGKSPSTETLSILDRWGAALSHRSAASLWGLLEPGEGPICLSVAGIAGKLMHRGVHVHRSRTLRFSMVTSHLGIPVTTPARMIADLRLAASIRGCPGGASDKELRRAIRQAAVLGLWTDEEELVERTRSDLELAFRQLCRRYSLPTPEVNVRVGGYEVDFLWRDRRVVVETDGYRYHRGRAAFEHDRRRDLSLRAFGYDVLRLTEGQIEDEPRFVTETLRKALGQRSDRRTV